MSTIGQSATLETAKTPQFSRTDRNLSRSRGRALTPAQDPARPLLLDLFCCEGGASTGYWLAGYRVVGLDLFEKFTRARYPFPAHRGDAIAALDVLLAGDRIELDTGHRIGLGDLSAIAASPPCQRYSITNAARRAEYPDLIGPTRDRLEATGLPYVIENVVGAPLLDPVELCGCMFGMSAVDHDGITLHLHRRRRFESNLPLSAPRPHDHAGHDWIGGSYGGARRDKFEARYVRKGGYVPARDVQAELLGIDWMTERGMHQAIPPTYTEHLGRQLMSLAGRPAVLGALEAVAL